MPPPLFEKFRMFPAIGEPCINETSRFSEKLEFPEELGLDGVSIIIFTSGFRWNSRVKNVEIIVKMYMNKFFKQQYFDFSIRFDSWIRSL